MMWNDMTRKPETVNGKIVHAPVTNVLISVSKHSNGIRMWNVLYSGVPQIAATSDEHKAREYARALYHACKGYARLLFFDGDVMDSDTLIESKLPNSTSD